ncbi:MAG: HutP family protein [Clostridiales bacterium]|nr:HutP family protein [Clostridiales bacterium]MBT9259912.1 HutP family protein [Clostridiales bacterium]
MEPNLKAGRAALALALTATRSEEEAVRRSLREEGVLAAATDFGGSMPEVISATVQKAVVAARREGVVADIHPHTGAVAGSAREALLQVATKALGFNVGGKLAIARYGEHLVVAVFVGVGLLHLDDVAVGLAHRAIPSVSGEG